MPAGLQIFGPAGELRLDTADSITRIVGLAAIAGTSSVGVPSGRAWFTILESNGFGFEECAFQFTISGGTISWTPFAAEPLSPPPPAPIIAYGAY